FPAPSSKEGEECRSRSLSKQGASDRRPPHTRRCRWSDRERWEEIRRLWFRDRVPIAQIARQLDLDRKTVRRCIRDSEWRAYQRPPRTDTLLAPHADYLRARAPQVRYSAQILFQELRQRGYRGSYDTVKLFVQPLRP